MTGEKRREGPALGAPPPFLVQVPLCVHLKRCAQKADAFLIKKILLLQK